MKIISISEMRRLEAASADAGVPPHELLVTAGTQAGFAIRGIVESECFGAGRRVVFFVGKGNNGGDGWVAARTLRRCGVSVRVVSLSSASAPDANAAEFSSDLPEEWVRFIGDCASVPSDILQAGDVIVDGLLGIGAKGAPRGLYADAISCINASGLPVIALDTPSGLDGDTGEGAGAVVANWTLAMGFAKRGCFVGDGPRCTGRLRQVSIGLPEAVAESAQGVGEMTAFGLADAKALLVRRPFDGHKNTFGHLVCFANSRQYSGAGFLAAVSALRMGAGLVTLAVPGGSELRTAPLALMVRRLGTAEDGAFSSFMEEGVLELSQKASGFVYGPGTGGNASPDCLYLLMKSRKPLVLDADGLRMLAKYPSLVQEGHGPMVLTPHPGEMALLQRAFGMSETGERWEQARALAELLGGTVVLKGHRTCVASAGEALVSVNTSGDNSLATAGSGDVLAGMVGALLAGGMTAFDAARLGVYLHGMAAELRRMPARCLVADDLLELIPRAVELVEDWM